MLHADLEVKLANMIQDINLFKTLYDEVIAFFMNTYHSQFIDFLIISHTTPLHIFSLSLSLLLFLSLSVYTANACNRCNIGTSLGQSSNE